VPIKSILLVVLGLGLLYGLFTVGLPFLMAMVIAVFLESPTRFLMKKLRLNRATASTIVCLLFTLALIGLVYLLGIQIFQQLVAFWSKAPEYLERANHYIQDAISRFYETLPRDMAEQIQGGLTSGFETVISSLNSLLKGISGYFLNVAKAIPNLFLFFVVFLVALFMISYSLPDLKNGFVAMFEEKSRPKVEQVLDQLRTSIFGFIRTQIIISALTYVIGLFGLLVLDVEYPLAVTLVIVIVDILPVLGIGTVLMPWTVYEFATNNVYLGVGLLVLFIVLTVIRRIVEPKILGDSVGISALAALVGLYVGFELIGVVGLFLGPIVIIIYKAMRRAGLLQFKIKLE